MSEIHIEIRPRKQFRAYLERKERWACLVVHRRGGKTFSCIQDLILKAATFKRPGPPPRYAYIAPTREQAKDVAWGYLKTFTWQIPGVITNESELKITFADGASIRLYSGDNYERMRGLYFDGVVMDEMADMDPMAWSSVIRPCLSDYQGWATFIGTPKGKNAFYRTHLNAVKDPDWFSLVLRSSSSGILNPIEVEDIRRSTPPAIFEQEYECNFNIGIPGAIYAKEVGEARETGRVRDFMPDRGALVHTAWDLGSPENTSVVYFQRVGPFLYIVDHDKGLRLTTAERVAHMTAKGYALGCHCLPHDSASKRPGGLSFVEELAAAGLQNVRVIPRTDDPERRINRMWETFPNTYFHEARCEKLLESLENYRRRDEISSATIRSEILHDWASHDADAFGYIAEAEMAGVITENLPRIGQGGRPSSVRVKTAVGTTDDWEADDLRKIRVKR